MPFSVTMPLWSISLKQSLYANAAAAAALGLGGTETSLQPTAACSVIHIQLDGFGWLRLLVS